MNKLQRALGIGALTLALWGCAEEYQPQSLEGKVIKKSVPIVGHLGNSYYILTVETTEGKYTFVIGDSYKKPASALAETIDIGSRVRFNTTDPMGLYKGQSYFTQDKVGRVPSAEIELLRDTDSKVGK